MKTKYKITKIRKSKDFYDGAGLKTKRGWEYPVYLSGTRPYSTLSLNGAFKRLDYFIKYYSDKDKNKFIVEEIKKNK